MHEAELPDLTFATVRLGVKETPWDLRCLLYRGGAAAKANHVAALIARGALGRPVRERIDLVTQIHGEIVSALIGGGSRETARNRIYCVRWFVAWMDDVGSALSVETVEDAFIHWTDYIVHRQRIAHDLKETGAYRSTCHEEQQNAATSL